jgi:serine/threonine-protein kinase
MSSEYRYRPGEIVPGTDLKIIMPIGSGGMGSVYEVEETSVEAPFVMKVIHPELLRDNAEHVRERMRREAKTLAQLSHKHIVRVYRAGLTAESPPMPFYVMDMLSGHTLSQILHSYASKQRLLPLALFFQVAKSLLSALDYAHKRGVIHRDVKPANIFMHRPEGEAPILKLLDFGIMATVTEMSEKTGLTGDRFAGTYTHAAPEQLQGDSPTAAMDVYAAGLVLYEMLTGVHPFEGSEHPASWIQAHVHKAPATILLRRQVPPELEKVVLGMVAKVPLERPRPAGAIIKMLDAIEEKWRGREPEAFRVNNLELSSEADLGKHMPTNMSSILFNEWLKSDPEPPPTRTSQNPAGPAVVTHSTWGGTLTGKASRISVGRVLLAALGFWIVTVAITWTLLARRGESAKATAPEVTAPIAPAVVQPAESIRPTHEEPPPPPAAEPASPVATGPSRPAAATTFPTATTSPAATPSSPKRTLSSARPTPKAAPPTVSSTRPPAKPAVPAPAATLPPSLLEP